MKVPLAYRVSVILTMLFPKGKGAYVPKAAKSKCANFAFKFLKIKNSQPSHPKKYLALDIKQLLVK